MLVKLLSCKRILILIALLGLSWCVMTFTHELGHILGGWCCGGRLTEYKLRPWRLPFSFFSPDPHPLITLWSGPVFGAAAPLLIGLAFRRDWAWFVAWFCVLANGTYLAVAWTSGDSQLDTTKLLQHGTHPMWIIVYCAATIGFGYVGFRRYCVRLLTVNEAGSSGQPELE